MLPAGVDGEGWSAWPAPAKLNLSLRIVGRRADGYHLLQTVFRLLDWGDTVYLRVRDDGRIVRVAGPDNLPADDDLSVRAARALQAASGCALGADIALDKRIPQGGGLGGGSSDAATVLRALNLLWGCALDEQCLARIGLALGADVPVFVHGRDALAEGVGEQLTPLVLPPAWYVVIWPGVAVPTAALFRAPELTRDAAPETIARLSCGAVCGNAFEPVVRSRYPAVAAALDWLGGSSAARLSGSGACIFAELADRASAERIARACPAPWKAWVAAGAERSPLLAALEDFGKVRGVG